MVSAVGRLIVYSAVKQRGALHRARGALGRLLSRGRNRSRLPFKDYTYVHALCTHELALPATKP